MIYGNCTTCFSRVMCGKASPLALHFSHRRQIPLRRPKEDEERHSLMTSIHSKGVPGAHVFPLVRRNATCRPAERWVFLMYRPLIRQDVQVHAGDVQVCGKCRSVPPETLCIDSAHWSTLPLLLADTPRPMPGHKLSWDRAGIRAQDSQRIAHQTIQEHLHAKSCMPRTRTRSLRSHSTRSDPTKRKADTG